MPSSAPGVSTEVDVGERLRDIRRLRRATLKTIADRAGVSESFLSQVPIFLYSALRFPSNLPQVIAVAVVVLVVSLVVVVGAEIGRRVAERRLGTT